MSAMRSGSRDRQRGNAAVETMWILPVWILLSLGVLDIGRAWFQYNTLTYAAREGARLASVTPGVDADSSQVRSRIEQILLEANMTARSISVQVVPEGASSSWVDVQVQTDFQPILLMAWPGPSRFPLRTGGSARYEA